MGALRWGDYNNFMLSGYAEPILWSNYPGYTDGVTLNIQWMISIWGNYCKPLPSYLITFLSHPSYPTLLIALP